MHRKHEFKRTAKCSYHRDRLRTRSFAHLDLLVDNANDFQHILLHGFFRPMLIAKHVELGIVVPPSTTTLNEIAALVGPQHPVKLIEVGTQHEIVGYTFQQYCDYLNNRSRHDHKVLNLISLEFSKTPLTSKVNAPSIVRQIDWIDVLWPLSRRARGDFPQVQKYLLCGMAEAYTDFHIDFGGTSVWYHVVWGKKRFFLIEPTIHHLKLYEEWSCNPDQDSVFLGDLVEQCYQVDIEPGQTFFIPSGWIHAVYTPEDSLVFGGNFLHCFSLLHQLQVDLIESRTHVAQQYRFPYFQQINWYALVQLLPYAIHNTIHLFSNTTTTTSTATVALLEKLRQLFEPKLHVLTEMNDDDDYDEDLNRLSTDLLSAEVLRQLPYLIKTCELWFNNNSNSSNSDRKLSEKHLQHSSYSVAVSQTINLTKQTFQAMVQECLLPSKQQQQQQHEQQLPLQVEEVCECWWLIVQLQSQQESANASLVHRICQLLQPQSQQQQQQQQGGGRLLEEPQWLDATLVPEKEIFASSWTPKAIVTTTTATAAITAVTATTTTADVKPEPTLMLSLSKLKANSNNSNNEQLQQQQQQQQPVKRQKHGSIKLSLQTSEIMFQTATISINNNNNNNDDNDNNIHDNNSSNYDDNNNNGSYSSNNNSNSSSNRYSTRGHRISSAFLREAADMGTVKTATTTTTGKRTMHPSNTSSLASASGVVAVVVDSGADGCGDDDADVGLVGNDEEAQFDSDSDASYSDDNNNNNNNNNNNKKRTAMGKRKTVKTPKVKEDKGNDVIERKKAPPKVPQPTTAATTTTTKEVEKAKAKTSVAAIRQNLMKLLKKK